MKLYETFYDQSVNKDQMKSQNLCRGQGGRGIWIRGIVTGSRVDRGSEQGLGQGTGTCSRGQGAGDRGQGTVSREQRQQVGDRWREQGREDRDRE